MGGMADLLDAYNKKKADIKARLKYFESVYYLSDEKLFAELAFCLCTPQSKAFICDKAIKNLEDHNLLLTADQQKIKFFLMGVRFNNNKSKYIVEARNLFTQNNKLKLKQALSQFKDHLELREWLIKNIKGLGYKEASHFLRNIGLYKNITILDRHILKNLHKHGVIKEIPNPLTKKKYLEIEKQMIEFSNKIKVPVEELDLLFWSEETGEIFK